MVTVPLIVPRATLIAKRAMARPPSPTEAAPLVRERATACAPSPAPPVVVTRATARPNPSPAEAAPSVREHAPACMTEITTSPPLQGVDKYRGEQQAGETRTSRGDDNSWGDRNKAFKTQSRFGDDVTSVPPGTLKRVVDSSTLMKEVKYRPPDAPDYAGQLHVRPPDKCAKNYVSRGGSPHKYRGDNDNSAQLTTSTEVV